MKSCLMFVENHTQQTCKKVVMSDRTKIAINHYV